MSNITFKEIRDYTEAKLWALNKEATDQTCLVHDYGVGGLDGLEFMEEFSKSFDVELSGFDWLKYFGPEASANPFGLLAYLFKRFIKRVPARELVDLPELTLGHLTICANNKKWSEP